MSDRLHKNIKGVNDWFLTTHFRKGAIIGEVDIVDCVTKSTSPWFEGPFGFVLRNHLL